jgi:hypothetical protein
MAKYTWEIPLEPRLETIEDAKEWVKKVCEILGPVFHPDKSFADYLRADTHEPMFASEEVKMLNGLMELTFVLFEQDDIYLYCIEELCITIEDEED